MKQRTLMVATAGAMAFGLAVGCAEILGLEPVIGDDGGSGGGTAGKGGTGGGAGGDSGGSAGTTNPGGGGAGGDTTTTTTPGACTKAADCPVAELPPCTKTACINQVCTQEPANDGEAIPCYEGPIGTEGVGPCKIGTTTCNGGVPGSCAGQVTPGRENCATVTDEDCDGLAPACPGTILQMVQISAGGANDLRGVAYDAEGNLYISGVHTQAINVQGCNLPLLAAGGAFVAKLNGDLVCQWAARVDATTTALDLSHIGLTAGTVWVAGSVPSNDVDIIDGPGAATFFKAVNNDALVLALSTATGALIEATVIGGADDDFGASLVAGEKVHVAVQGGSGQIRRLVQPNTLDDFVQSAVPDIVVVTFNALTGKEDWTATFGSTQADYPRALGLAADKLLVGGSVLGGVAVGNCMLVSGVESSAFLVELNVSNGNHVGAICDVLGSASTSFTSGLTGTNDGRFAATGFTGGSTNFPVCDTTLNAGSSNAWLRLGQLGSPCTHSLIVQGPTTAAGVRAQHLGSDVLFLGSYTGSLGLGTSLGRDLFFHSYSAQNLAVTNWHVELGAGGDDDPRGFALSPSGEFATLVGTCRGMQFGGKFDCDSEGDGFLVRIAVGSGAAP